MEPGATKKPFKGTARPMRLAQRVGLNKQPIAPPATASSGSDVRRTIKKKKSAGTATVAAATAAMAATAATAEASDRAIKAVLERPSASESAGTTESTPSIHTPAPPATAGAGATPAGSGRPWTVTVALPGSIVENAQTQELRSYLVGQVARACAIFNVDEVVVFGSTDPPPPDARGRTSSSGAVFMARVLQYLECPQYLRKQCFPHHPDLRSVGLIPPLDAPHHLRIDERGSYREAIVQTCEAESCTVYTGLPKELTLKQPIPVGTRVTVRLPPPGASQKVKPAAVSPREPRERAGMYWGYTVRMARSLSAVWSECPFDGGYDVSVGTSEHGSDEIGEGTFSMPGFRHLLIVLGGVEGLEPVVAAEEELADCDEDVSSLFDHYLNLCPKQGSRTIRTEEALLVCLTALRPYIDGANS